MAFFPESIMPNRLKDESQDIKGNKFVITATDVNKHDEEIRAIERSIGIRRPRFPASGFSGACDANGDFVEGCLDSEKVSGVCPGGSPPDCEIERQDILSVMQSLSERLSQIRDDTMFQTSGIVRVRDPFYPGADGKIVWPTDFPVTTLASDIPDDTVDSEEDLDDLSEVTLDDVSGLPDGGGFITIINDASTLLFRSGSRNLRIIGFTSLATELDPIFDQSEIVMDDSISRRQRILALGTNVEILEYEELDEANNKLLGVSRKQLGTTSTRHAVGDLVFKGRASIMVSPINYKLSDRRIDQVDCVLRSDGSVDLRVRNRDRNAVDPDDDDDTIISYAHYHAIVLRELEPLPVFDPGGFGDCPNIL